MPATPKSKQASYSWERSCDASELRREKFCQLLDVVWIYSKLGNTVPWLYALVMTYEEGQSCLSALLLLEF
jgi:hypothetical protein